MTTHVNVICMKWGTLYGPHYVNRLYRMTARNLSRPFRFVCFTDDARDLRPEVETAPIPAIRIDPSYENLPWKKLAVYATDLGGLCGPALYLDLDVVVIGDLDAFFEYPGAYCIIHNWTHPDRLVGNSSVFRFEIGAHVELLERYEQESTQHWIDLYRNEQAYLSHVLGRDRLTYWPADWCASFKKHCLPGGIGNWVKTAQIPDGARIVVFHGHPNPDDAMIGNWPGSWYKRLRPVPWIGEHWNED